MGACSYGTSIDPNHFRQQEEDFGEIMDPWGDRDLIIVEFRGQKIFGKIDTYDPSMEFMSPDPADDLVTVRVLTVRFDFEY